MRKAILLIPLLTLLFSTGYAQHTLTFTQVEKLFYDGKEFYEQRKYTASYRNFEQFLRQSSPTNVGMIAEADYYLAANAYELRQANAQSLLTAYLLHHPYTPHYDRVHYLLGILSYEEGDYPKALSYFEKVNDTKLLPAENIDFLFSYGYTNLEIDQTRRALQLFDRLKTVHSPHITAAKYYAGYCAYRLGDYDVALKDLRSIENNPQFADIAPYYVAQIYYAKGEFDQVEKRAKQLLKRNPNSLYNAELYRMIGEKAYADGNYTKAIDNLNRYEKLFPDVLRNDMYYLGVSYLKTNQPQLAIQYLSKVTNQADEMAESAYLELGNAYLAIKDINNARMAFSAALKTNYNSTVREEATYNYALTTYPSDTGFGESIKAFETFIKEFPQSKYIDNAYDYLSTVYLTSNNYEEAYQSILKIKKLTPTLKETKQYLEYQVGVDAFLTGDYHKAISYFTLAGQSASQGKYQPDIAYWRAESNYRIGRYAQATYDWVRFFSYANITQNPNYLNAFYGLGYAYFAQQKYTQSLPWFLKYLNKASDKKTKQYFDAQNRVGDVYFHHRNLLKANEYYQSSAQNMENGDYPLYQSGYLAGLEKNYPQKIEKLNLLIRKYPNSPYADDAQYEIGRAYILLGKHQEAIKTYQQLISTYPNSLFAPKSLIEMGLIYFDKKAYEKAKPLFKEVISTYPASEEANTALESLETLSIETNDVANFLQYTQKIGKVSQRLDAQKTDSIIFLAAEKKYINADYSAAVVSLKNYLDTNCPAGKYCNIAQYYLVQSYYQVLDTVKALELSADILEKRGHPYAVKIVQKAAKMNYVMHNYPLATQYYEQLYTLSQTSENKQIAQIGLLNSYYQLKQYQKAVEVAQQIIDNGDSSDKMLSQARYISAKAHFKDNQLSDALKDLKSTKIDPRTRNGAETKYLLAQTYLRLNLLNDAEREVLEFAKTGTSHQYWLAKGFIVLSDVYVKKGEDFQAKQYLLSLQKNYTKQDTIQSMIIQRLETINKRSQSNIIN